MATGQFVFPGAEGKTAAAVATSTWGALQRRQLGWRGTTQAVHLRETQFDGGVLRHGQQRAARG